MCSLFPWQHGISYLYLIIFLAIKEKPPSIFHASSPFLFFLGEVLIGQIFTSQQNGLNLLGVFFHPVYNRFITNSSSRFQHSVSWQKKVTLLHSNSKFRVSATEAFRKTTFTKVSSSKISPETSGFRIETTGFSNRNFVFPTRSLVFLKTVVSCF
jgi:hypothetical protein